MKAGKLIFLLFISFASFWANGQLNMSLQVPGGGMLQKSQLWNVLLVSASDRPVNVRLSFTVTDTRTNQPVLGGVSRVFLLNKGAKQVQLGDLAPVQYDYFSPAIDKSPNGLLPLGNYRVCYTLLQAVYDGFITAAEDCALFAVEPVSPPMLHIPGDQSELSTRLPRFAWLPPAPVSAFNSLEYEMKLVEMKPGQSVVEAVQQNIAIYSVTHCKNLFADYPASAKSLDTGKNYAWQVIAANNQQFAAQSEVWSFRISGKDLQPSSEETAAYIELKKELDASIAICKGDLRIAYDNDCNDHSVNYEVLVLENDNPIVKRGHITLTPGKNLIQVGFKRKELKQGKMYLFRLMNSRKENWNVKFIYSN